MATNSNNAVIEEFPVQIEEFPVQAAPAIEEFPLPADSPEVAAAAQNSATVAGQALDVATLPSKMDWRAANEHLDQQRFYESESLKAQARLREDQGFTSQPGSEAFALREKAQQIRQGITPNSTIGQKLSREAGAEQRGQAEAAATAAHRTTPSEALTNLLGPGISQTVVPIAEGAARGLGGATGGAAGAALGTAATMGVMGPLGLVPLIYGIGGAILGQHAGSAVQEKILQIGETPLETEQRQQRAAEDYAANPGLSKIGAAAANLPFFGPSLAQFARAGAGDIGAIRNIGVGGVIGGGLEAGMAKLRGEEVKPEDIAEAAFLGAMMNEPTALGRKLGLHPSSEQAAVEAAQKAYGVKGEKLSEIAPEPIGPQPGEPNAVQEQSTNESLLRSAEAGKEGVGLPKVGEGNAVAPEAQGAAPQEGQVADIAPAIRVGDKVIRGNPGETHQDIVRRFMDENPDEAVDAVSNFDTKANPNFFVDAAGNEISRAELKDRFGVSDSQGLRDLQAKQVSPQMDTAPAPPSSGEPAAQAGEQPPVGGPGAMGPTEAAEMQAAGKTTALKRAVVDTERLNRGAEEIPTPERLKTDQIVRNAEDAVDADPSLAPSIISRVVDQNQKAITHEEAAALLVERVRLSNETAVWEERKANGEDAGVADAHLAELERQAERLDRAQRAAGSEWSDVGRMYQNQLRDDFTVDALKRKARAAKKGPLNAEETAKIKEQADQIKELQEKVDAGAKDAEKLREAQDTTRTMEATIKELQADRPKFGKQVFEIAHKIVDRWKADAELARKSLRDRLKNASIPIGDVGVILDVARVLRAKIGEFGLSKAESLAEMIAEFGDFVKPHFEKAWTKAQQLIDKEKMSAETRAAAKSGVKKKGERTAADALNRAKADAAAGDTLQSKTVYEIARSHINEGVHGEDAVMKATHETIKRVYPEATERDVRRAFSEYGKVKFPSKEATAKELRELRTLVRLQESIDRETEGLSALHTGLQRDKATQAIREKQAQLNELLKKRQGPLSPEQLATRDEARKTALKNQIADLDKQLQTGVKPVKGEPAPMSSETQALVSLRDAMREKLREIEAEAAPKKSEAEKQIEALSKQRQRVDDILSGKETPKTPKEWEALSQQAADIKSEILAMQELAAQMRRDAKPKTDPNFAKEQAQIKALEASIKNYEEKTAAGDFSPQSKLASRPDTEKVAALRAIKDARKAVYDAAKKAGKPVRSPEQVYNDTRLKSVRKQIAAAEEKIRTGNFEKVPRRPLPPKSPEVVAEEAKLEMKKAEVLRGFHEMRRAQRTRYQKVKDFIADTWSASRPILASTDFSAPGRQGAFFALPDLLLNPKRLGRQLRSMLSGQFSETKFHEKDVEIKSRENADIYEQSGLYLADIDHKPSAREESFKSELAEKIPGVGRVVRGSNRGFTTMLNTVRADAMDSFISWSGGRDKVTPETAKFLAEAVNDLTGRGNVTSRQAAGAMEWLAKYLFSPRLWVSRFNTATLKPVWRDPFNTAISPRARAVVLGQYAKFVGTIAALGFLAKMWGGKVDEDPRSSDFGKLQFGSKRYDVSGGIGNMLTFLTRIVSGKTKDDKGRLLRIAWQDEKRPERELGQIIFQHLRNKAAPVPGAVYDYFYGRHPDRSKVTAGSMLKQTVVPITVSDTLNYFQKESPAGALRDTLINSLGVPVNDYSK